MNSIPVGARPMKVYPTISIRRENMASRKSNNGEWISFVAVFGIWGEELEGIWEASPSKGVVSVPVGLA